MHEKHFFLKAVIPVFFTGFFAAAGDCPAAQTGSAHFKFDFGPGKVAAGYSQVLPTTIYSKEFGYGFEPGTTVSGFEHNKEALHGDGVTSDRPFFFSIALPEGNYRVTVKQYRTTLISAAFIGQIDVHKEVLLD